jgi:hypothetical protein
MQHLPMRALIEPLVFAMQEKQMLTYEAAAVLNRILSWTEVGDWQAFKASHSADFTKRYQILLFFSSLPVIGVAFRFPTDFCRSMMMCTDGVALVAHKCMKIADAAAVAAARQQPR